MSRPTVPSVYGPLLIGVFLNTILYGVVMIQSLTYYRTYMRDKAWIRYFVLYLFVLETLNTGFNIGMMYQPLVLKFGLEETLFYTPAMLILGTVTLSLAPINTWLSDIHLSFRRLDPVITGMISTSAQFFIAWRIKVISQSKNIPIVICILALVSLGGASTLTAFVAIQPEFPHLRAYKGAIITWLVSSTVADLLITVTLAWTLTKRKTGMKETDDKISRIIRLTVHTGLLTSVLSLTDAIVFLAVPDTTLNFIWDLPLAKVYAISLLSTLNARYPSSPGAGHISTSSANDNNVLFGRLVSQWRTASRGEASTTVSNRSDLFELQAADRKSAYMNRPKEELGVDNRGGVSVHTVVHTMLEDGQDSELDKKHQSDSL
ncbi:hypothetical protein CPB83DRAFT_899035 [Crepidotus variabilis]|uniref:DUF6534 domain-containing protein n=1 Tax=Crepidotus variabilis TaxID=179855 RepID=A0A9P6E5Z2_9AGAR|nr:hypothetical protein CPB83DRAFT_899035 [Crepidotus variabilis]